MTIPSDIFYQDWQLYDTPMGKNMIANFEEIIQLDHRQVAYLLILAREHALVQAIAHIFAVDDSIAMREMMPKFPIS